MLDTVLLCVLLAVDGVLLVWLWLHAVLLRTLHQRQLQVEASTKNLAEFLAKLVLHDPQP